MSCVACQATPSVWLPLEPVSGVVIGGMAITVAAGVPGCCACAVPASEAAASIATIALIAVIDRS